MITKHPSGEETQVSVSARIEEELRIKESVIYSSINGIAIGDLEGTLTYVNDAALRLFGDYSASEIIGKSAFIFAFSEEQATAVFETVHKKGSWVGEITGKKKDGSPIFVHLSANTVNNENGDPICLMCSFVDITDRKRIDEELRIKEYAIASSINGIGIGDLQGNITYVNEAALRMWGADDASEVLGKSALEFAASEEEAIRVYAEFMEKGGWSGEISGRRKDGSPITVHLSASLVKNDRGEPICTMDSFVDITDRKRMEEELRIKESAIKSSINGIAIGDLEGNITYVNEAFVELWGGTDPSEVLGKSALEFTQLEEEAVGIIDAVRERGNWIGEITGIRRDGIPITVQLSTSMVYDDAGKPICMMCSFVNVTARKEAEEKLLKAYEDLEIRIEERTRDLRQANIKLKKEIEERKTAEKSLLKKEKELELKSLNLEEANTALKVLLKRREQDKDELEEKVLANIKELALPYIEKIKSSRLNDKQTVYVDVLESNLANIISPFLKKLSAQYINLSPTEIQVANLVRDGRSTKDIAEMLNISERGIEFHRNNIRLKLGIKNRKTNLRSYLLSLT
ncbi:MAG: PAS domain S-box protein [Deltaproteobacteria bacterium]|nr:PAS domain S-box protein [Deltaproteobacteria bacterium]